MVAFSVGLVSCTAPPPPGPGPSTAATDPAAASPGPTTAQAAPEFPPLEAGAGGDTGSSDFVTGFAAAADTVVAVGMVSSNRMMPVFRYSSDDGATWQLGGLSQESAAAVPPDVDEEVNLVAAAAPGPKGTARWLAVGGGAGNHVTWTSVDGRTWDRHEIDAGQLGDQDGVWDLAVIPDGFLLVGTRGADGDRPMAWRSPDGVAWTAQALGGRGVAKSAAVHGSTVVVVGSTTKRGQDSYASWASNDRGRRWLRGEKVPAPEADTGFSREFDSVTATAEGFTAMGSYYADEWRSGLHVSEDGRNWRSVSGGAMGTKKSTQGDEIDDSDAQSLAVTQQLAPTYRPRLWRWTTDGWQEPARTPLDGSADRVRGYSWVADAPTRIDGGWLVVASRQDNGRVVSEIWRSRDEGRTFAVVATPRAPGDQPTVWPRGVVRRGDQTMVVGDSLRRPVFWQRTGTSEFGAPTLVSKRIDERVDGVVAGGGTVLAYGSRSADGNDTARVWRLNGNGWAAPKADVFSEPDNDYASSEIRGATWWRKRWVAVGSTSRNGDLNASALAATSTDGTSWKRGRGARTYAKAGGKVWYDVTDLEGDHDRTRAMAAVIGAGDRLVAVGTSSEGDQDRATVWASTDGRRWSMTRLPLDGMSRTRLSAVAARGSIVVALGTGAAAEGEDDRLMIWTSFDRGRTWRRQVLDERLDTGQPMLVATAAGFAVATHRTDPISRPVLLVAADGRAWRERPFDAVELPDDVGAVPTAASADGAELLVLIRVLSRGDGGVARLVRQRID